MKLSLVALTAFLKSVHNIVMILDPIWHCRSGTFFLWAASLCSTLFILSMTFDRFYSIIQPHKAAS